jgi:thiol-disulfide isomerase/thioredoxin
MCSGDCDAKVGILPYDAEGKYRGHDFKKESLHSDMFICKICEMSAWPEYFEDGVMKQCPGPKPTGTCPHCQDEVTSINEIKVFTCPTCGEVLGENDGYLEEYPADDGWGLSLLEAEGDEIYWNASCKPCYWENRFISTDKGQLPDHCPQCNKAVTLVAVDVENNLLAAEGDEELTDEEKQEVWNIFQEEASSLEDPNLEQIKNLADKYLTDVIDDETPEFFVDSGLEDYYQFILTDPTYADGGEPEDAETAAMFEELKQVRYWATILTDRHIQEADNAAKAMIAAGIMGGDEELLNQGMLGLETNNQVQRERELIAQWLAEGGVHDN